MPRLVTTWGAFLLVGVGLLLPTASCDSGCAGPSVGGPFPGVPSGGEEDGVAPSSVSRAGWNAFARGVAWDANWEDRRGWYGSPAAKRGFDHLERLGATWIAVTPFAFQPSLDRPAIRFRPRWSPGLVADVKEAQRRGIKVLVKPHIWSNQFWDGSGHWRGTIEMRSERAWSAWFDHYRRWIVQEARRAQALGADAFCVGLEYVKSTRTHASRWRRVITAVREVFDGPLVYAAHLEELELPFWDALDAIGVNAYFPVAESRAPTLAEVQQRWQAAAGRLARLAARHRRPVVFTEVGYASVDGAAQEPFRWPNESDRSDPGEQALCYRGLFAEAGKWPWFGGLFVWKYKITVPADSPPERHFVFQGKEAEAVIRRGFAQAFRRDSSLPLNR